MLGTTDGWSDKTGFRGGDGDEAATLGTRIYRRLAVVFTVLALFTPLVWLLQHLKSIYASSINLVDLRWFELVAVLAAILLPFMALSVLRIRWNNER